MLTVADAAFDEISSLLSEIEGLVAASTSDATLSAGEIAANQSQIDDALTAIDRIVNTTNFNGKKLLDGTYGIQTMGVAGNSDISNVRVFSRSQATSDTVLTIERVASAQPASATFANMDGAATTRTNGTTEVVIRGALGTATLTLASALTQAEVVAAINSAKAQTGVSAIAGATDITLNSTTYGTDAFVSVEVLSGGLINSSYGTLPDDGDTTNDIQSVGKTTGADATITVNGQNAGTDGLDVVYSANGLSVEFTLGTDFGTGVTVATQTSFTVKADGGATFQLGTTPDTRQTIGIDSLAAYNLGGGNGTARLSELRSGGSVDLRADPAGALATIRDAMTELASIRGRFGGFQKYQVGAAIRSLEAANVGLTRAASVIGDTDFALATARLNQETVLVQSTIQLLGVANQQAAQILSLL
jgi:flagellin